MLTSTPNPDAVLYSQLVSRPDGQPLGAVLVHRCDLDHMFHQLETEGYGHVDHTGRFCMTTTTHPPKTPLWLTDSMSYSWSYSSVRIVKPSRTSSVSTSSTMKETKHDVHPDDETLLTEVVTDDAGIPTGVFTLSWRDVLARAFREAAAHGYGTVINDGYFGFTVFPGRENEAADYIEALLRPPHDGVPRRNKPQ